jgi:hypothetical protein
MPLTEHEKVKKAWEGAKVAPFSIPVGKTRVDLYVGCPGCGVVMKGSDLIEHLPECFVNERRHN